MTDTGLSKSSTDFTTTETEKLHQNHRHKFERLYTQQFNLSNFNIFVTCSYNYSKMPHDRPPTFLMCTDVKLGHTTTKKISFKRTRFLRSSSLPSKTLSMIVYIVREGSKTHTFTTLHANSNISFNGKVCVSNIINPFWMGTRKIYSLNASTTCEFGFGRDLPKIAHRQ